MIYALYIPSHGNDSGNNIIAESGGLGHPSTNKLVILTSKHMSLDARQVDQNVYMPFSCVLHHRDYHDLYMFIIRDAQCVCSAFLAFHHTYSHGFIT